MNNKVLYIFVDEGGNYILKYDRSNYPFGRTPWVLIVRAVPF